MKDIPLAQKMSKCGGCHDDFYNRPQDAKPGEGKAPNGHCWSLPDARLRWRWAIGMQTPMDRRSNFRRVQVYTCYHGSGPYRDVYMKRLPEHLGGEWADKQEQREWEATEAAPSY